jgi:hypothetical protein
MATISIVKMKLQGQMTPFPSKQTLNQRRLSLSDPNVMSSLMVVSLLMNSSFISVSGRPTPEKSIPSLFKPESATLQSGTILRPRVCWESKDLLRHCHTR